MLGTEMAKQTALRTKLTPAMANQLLELNNINRPISDGHVQRIAKQISDGKWKFNGDTIKIAATGDVLDGQHRCWAVIEAKQAVDTIIVTGIERDAFSTIDTLRKPRSGGDVIALMHQIRYRTVIAGALSWLVRWQRGVLEQFKEPINRIENSDIEAAFLAHNKGIVRAVERAMIIRRVANPSMMAFIYYIAANQNLELAEQMMVALNNPGRLAASHPFYQLRMYLIMGPSRQGRKAPLMTIALTIKALNAAYRSEPIRSLSWRSQGSRPEAFPVLKIAGSDKPRKAT